MRSLHTYLVIGILLLIVFAGYVLAFWNTDSHNLNSQYRLWKMGLLSISDTSELRYQFLVIDSGFRDRLKGMTMDELRRWYPILVEFGNGNSYQRCYEKGLLGMGYYWLGDSQFSVRFKDGIVYDVDLFKG
jgi:hypothetical protein